MNKFDTIFNVPDKKTDNYLETATKPTERKKSYVLTSLTLRGGYDLSVEAQCQNRNYADNRICNQR